MLASAGHNAERKQARRLSRPQAAAQLALEPMPMHCHSPPEGRQPAFEEILKLPEAGTTPAIDEQFPVKFANQLSRREAFNKHLFRPNTYLHKWWARRCGSTFRVILKQFAADPGQNDYYTPAGLKGKIVLDPMMGGGTTLHEAIRLGAAVIGADVDPIPVVQARASLSQVSLHEIERGFSRFFHELYGQVGRFFQTECPECRQTVDSQYTLWGVRKVCDCAEVVQIDRYVLRQEAQQTLQIRPDTWEIGLEPWASSGQRRAVRLITKQDTACPICGQAYRDLLDSPYHARYTPIAVAGRCAQHGFFLRAPGEADHLRIREADALRGALDFGSTADFAVRDGPKSGDLLRRNIHSYLEVFSSRQLLYLHRAIQLVGEYRGVVKLNLALLVSTALEFNSLLCGYKGWSKKRPGAIRHVFALHAYSFPYTAAENNPVNRRKSSGNLQLLFRDRIVRGRKWALAPVERKIGPKGKTQLVEIAGEWDGGVEVCAQAGLDGASQVFWLIHGDSGQLPIGDQAVDFIVTDPPYYDNVQYSNLAAFFRVWLVHLLPDEIDWMYDETRSAVATKAAAHNTGFVAGLSGIFQECGRVLKRADGRMAFTFHHWHPNAWAELTIALKSARFRLINAHVVFSENPISVHINNLNAIQHDAILVLGIGEDLKIRQWLPGERIDTSDSETFCRQCAQALGWLLEGDHAPTDIRDVWSTLTGY